MGLRNPLEGACCAPVNDGLVDELVGSAYETVRFVAVNIEYVKHVSAHMREVFLLAGALDAVELLAEKVATLDALSAALPTLERVEALVPRAEAVALRLEDVIGSVEAVVAVLDELLALQAQLPMLARIDAQAGKLVELHDHLAELLDIQANLERLLDGPGGIADLDQRTTALEGQLTNLKGRVTATENRNAAQDLALADHDARFVVVQAALDDDAADIGMLAQRVTALEEADAEPRSYSVNGKESDADGEVTLYGTDVPRSSSNPESVEQGLLDLGLADVSLSERIDAIEVRPATFSVNGKDSDDQGQLELFGADVPLSAGDPRKLDQVVLDLSNAIAARALQADLANAVATLNQALGLKLSAQAFQDAVGTAVAPLVGDKVPVRHIPRIAITDVFLLAPGDSLTGPKTEGAEEGDVAIVVDPLDPDGPGNGTWILANDRTVLSDWIRFRSPIQVVSAADIEDATAVGIQLLTAANAQAVKDLLDIVLAASEVSLDPVAGIPAAVTVQEAIALLDAKDAALGARIDLVEARIPATSGEVAGIRNTAPQAFVEGTPGPGPNERLSFTIQGSGLFAGFSIERLDLVTTLAGLVAAINAASKGSTIPYPNDDPLRASIGPGNRLVLTLTHQGLTYEITEGSQAVLDWMGFPAGLGAGEDVPYDVATSGVYDPASGRFLDQVFPSLDALHAAGTRAADPYYVFAENLPVAPPAVGVYDFVADGNPSQFLAEPGQSAATIALNLNTALGATVVSALENGRLLFSSTYVLDFRGTSQEGLSVLGLGPNQLLMDIEDGPALLSTSEVEDTTTGAKVGPRLSSTIGFLRSRVEQAIEGVRSLVGRVLSLENDLQRQTVVIVADPGEAGLRAAIAKGLAKVPSPSSVVIVDVPAQPDINLANSIHFDSVEAPRFFLRCPPMDLVPAPTGIVSAVSAGANNIWGVALYDVTLQTGANHGLVVNDNVMVVGRSVSGTPTGAYQPLAGYHRVRAVPAANQVTFRIPSVVSLVNLATALSGANSLSLTMHRMKVHLVAPLNAPALQFSNSRILGLANLGLEGRSNDNGVNAVPLRVTGVSTQIATAGSLGIRGGATGFNLLNGAVMRWGSPAQAIVASPDWVFAITGASNGCVVNVGTYFDGNMATSISSCGNALDAVFCQSGEADFPLLGMYGGNGQAAFRGIKRARSFFRINTIPLGIGSNTGFASSQVYADAVSYVDAQGLNTGIALSPAANQVGNNGSFITR